MTLSGCVWRSKTWEKKASPWLIFKQDRTDNGCPLVKYCMHAFTCKKHTHCAQQLTVHYVAGWSYMRVFVFLGSIMHGEERRAGERAKLYFERMQNRISRHPIIHWIPLKRNKVTWASTSGDLYIRTCAPFGASSSWSPPLQAEIGRASCRERVYVLV